MGEIKEAVKPRDYKEDFEFELTVGGNIICQRYFRINEFNDASLKSYELTEAVRDCVATIDADLKDKTQAYLEIYAPKVFNSIEEMNAYLANPENRERLTIGEGLVVRGNSTTDYVLTKDYTAAELNYKFDDGELTETDIQENKATYKFAFKVKGREACAMIWDGWYPKFVRDKIDLSNKRGKFADGDTSRLSFEQYLLYRMAQGKSDLVYGLISNLCYACSHRKKQDYTQSPDEIMKAWAEQSDRNLWKVR